MSCGKDDGSNFDWVFSMPMKKLGNSFDWNWMIRIDRIFSIQSHLKSDRTIPTIRNMSLFCATRKKNAIRCNSIFFQLYVCFWRKIEMFEAAILKIKNDKKPFHEKFIWFAYIQSLFNVCIFGLLGNKQKIRNVTRVELNLLHTVFMWKIPKCFSESCRRLRFLLQLTHRFSTWFLNNE